jgi:putative transposase
MRRPRAGLIHHSDRGSQYCSVDYQTALKKHRIQISMSGKDNCSAMLGSDAWLDRDQQAPL